MAAPSNTKSGVGFRWCQIFALDANGFLAAPDENAYEGVQVSGVRSLTLDIPESQQINHVGDDRIFAVDSLPPTESVTGQLVTGKNNFTVDALLTGANVVTKNEKLLFGRATDLQGSEVQVCVLAWRQALNTTPGESRTRVWDVRLLPVCQLIPMSPSFAQSDPEEMTYTIRPQVVAKYPWGTAFATGTEGFTEAQILDGITVGKPKLIAFLGDNSTVAFSLPASYPASATTKMTVWHYVTSTGVTTDVTGTVTLAVGSVTFGAAPATGDIVTVYYEYA